MVLSTGRLAARTVRRSWLSYDCRRSAPRWVTSKRSAP
jgi:hypothetical protein